MVILFRQYWVLEFTWFADASWGRGRNLLCIHAAFTVCLNPECCEQRSMRESITPEIDSQASIFQLLTIPVTILAGGQCACICKINEKFKLSSIFSFFLLLMVISSEFRHRILQAKRECAHKKCKVNLPHSTVTVTSSPRPSRTQQNTFKFTQVKKF